MYDVRIKGVVNGWIVEIGCSTFVAEDKEKMLKDIGDYIDHPEEAEKKHLSEAKNKTNNMPVEPCHPGLRCVEPQETCCESPG